ncbi:MAG: DUF3558 domain-containing protein, partial [Candidatus Dormibacteraceae bacterium]
MKQLLSLVALACAALLTTACSQTEPGQPSAANSAASLTAGTPNPAGLKIANPKNIKGLDPCQLLTNDQLAQLGATATPTTDKTPWDETYCDWRNDNLGLALAPETTLGTGITGTYARKNNFSKFQQSNVDGYPAARIDWQDLSCQIYVGVAQTEEFSIDFTRLGGKDPQYMD